MATAFRLTTEADLDLLDEVPPTVTTIVVRDPPVSFEFPRMPSHVHKLELYDVSLDGPVSFTEGLKELTLGQIDTEVGTAMWVFPASLEKVAVMGGRNRDLRAVTAPQLSLLHPRYKTDFRLPEGLDTLRVVAGVPTSEYLPPYLRCLHLDQMLPTGGFDQSRHSSVKEMTLSGPHVKVDFRQVFPKLEVLRIHDYRSGDALVVALPHLRELTLDRLDNSTKVKIDCPRLESLTIIRSHGATPFVLRMTPAKNLVSLTLGRVRGIPGEYPKLRSLTVSGSDLKLPRFPELASLTLDRPLLTNGLRVSDLAGYKAVWGLE